MVNEEAGARDEDALLGLFSAEDDCNGKFAVDVVIEVVVVRGAMVSSSSTPRLGGGEGEEMIAPEARGDGGGFG